MGYHGMIRGRIGVGRFVLVALTLLAAVPAAVAEDIDTQRFLPRATSGGYFVTEGSAVRHPLDPFTLGIWLSYGHNPLIAVKDDRVVAQIVAHQLAFDLTASYSFATWFELAMHAPIAYLSGDDLSEGAFGDLRVLPKFRLLDDETQAVGLAVLADVRLPTHTSSFYGGARLPALAPRLLLDHHFGLSGFRAGLDFGALLRKATEYRNIDAASELQAGVGLGYRFDGGQAPVEIMLDVRTFVGLKQPNAEEVGLEGLLGAGLDVSRDWKVNAGAGLGLLEGFGVPTARAFLGIRWEPSPNDPDHDGLRNSESTEADDTSEERQPPPEAGSPGDASDGAAEEDDGSDEPASVDDVDDAAREAAVRGGYDACPDLPEDRDGIETMTAAPRATWIATACSTTSTVVPTRPRPSTATRTRTVAPTKDLRRLWWRTGGWSFSRRFASNSTPPKSTEARIAFWTRSC